MGTDTHLFLFSPLPFFLSHPFFSPPPLTVLSLPYLSLLSSSCPLLCPLFFPSPPIHSSPLCLLPYFSFPYLYFPSSLLPSYSSTHSSPLSLPSQSSPTMRIVFSFLSHSIVSHSYLLPSHPLPFLHPARPPSKGSKPHRNSPCSQPNFPLHGDLSAHPVCCLAS